MDESTVREPRRSESVRKQLRLYLTRRLHVDLQRVTSASCPASITCA
ncbi:putative leader peptide [Mycolicibacterium sp. CBMA 234]